MSYTPRDQMLHSTSYNLNSSFTKQIIVGAELQKNENLTSIVQLVASHPRASISVHPEEWKSLKIHFNIIASYSDGQEKQQCIDCGNFRIHFIVSHVF